MADPSTSRCRADLCGIAMSQPRPSRFRPRPSLIPGAMPSNAPEAKPAPVDAAKRARAPDQAPTASPRGSPSKMAKKSSLAVARGEHALEVSRPQGADRRKPCAAVVDALARSVQQELRAALAAAPTPWRPAADSLLHQHGALDIRRATDKSGGLSSYKAPWSADACKNAILTTGWYEAGGNIFWADPVPRGLQHERLAGDQDTWEDIEAVAQQFFPRPWMRRLRALLLRRHRTSQLA